ncbi:hypothetical protein SAMN02745161_1813 [Halodesulfovibrio marinisediminis DSM 17456]|uniref:Uncharacterized protein n=1 Tax=Halodesulfovibrio marinisediminis DSM 17456 TaxID=1121457 RepID=A0A1N6GUK1_9BACT|nr:hypothetical protein SAMN02745161_1813 [Halodesulfovibrio marinisediminis DSM 17456]
MRQEKLIAIVFVVASMIFSTVTYSFGQEVVVVKKFTPVRVEAVDYGMCRVAPCGTMAVRRVVTPGCCSMYMVPMGRHYMVCPYHKRYPCVKRCAYMTKCPSMARCACMARCPYMVKCGQVKRCPYKTRVMKVCGQHPKKASGVQNTSYGLKYYYAP